MIVAHVLNQKVYAGAGDVDDCGPVSAIMAYAAQPGHLALPDIPTFRRAAGVPDKAGPTGTNATELATGARKLWPATHVDDGTFRWPGFRARMEAGRIPAALAVHSGSLPANLRFGFAGAHFVVVFVEAGQWYCANPLAPNGSAPIALRAIDVYHAAAAFTGAATASAVIFPAVPAAGPTVAELVAELAVRTGERDALAVRLAQAQALAASIGRV